LAEEDADAAEVSDVEGETEEERKDGFSGGEQHGEDGEEKHCEAVVAGRAADEEGDSCPRSTKVALQNSAMSCARPMETA